MLVRVLGSVELVAGDGSAVSLPGARQPALLAALAGRANEVVSSDRLITLLWGDDLPVNPEASLHSAVFKLRNSLRSAGGRDVLLTRERGYRLSLLPGDLDADRFADLVREARDQPPGEAVDTLTAALELWRGPAYAGFADTEVAHLEALRLEEVRRTAVERLADALASTGRTDEVVQLLEPFVAEQPLREAARATLMRALHAQGRTAEAETSFRRALELNPRMLAAYEDVAPHADGELELEHRLAGGLLLAGEHAGRGDELPDLRGNLLHDAHTAILMREHGVRTIYTLDADFRRFTFLDVVDPFAD